VHGVTVRSPDGFAGIEEHLRRSIAPVLVRGSTRASADVAIRMCYWGDLGMRFAWGLQSLPSRSQVSVVPMGPVAAGLDDKLVPLASGLSLGIGEILMRLPVASTTTSGNAVTPGSTEQTTFSYCDADTVAGLLVTTLVSQDPSIMSPDGTLERLPLDVAQTSMILDQAAHDEVPFTQAGEDPLATLERIAARARQIALDQCTSGAFAEGPDQIMFLIDRAMSGVKSLTLHASDATGTALATALLAIRPPLSEYVTRVLGDIFGYLRSRDELGDKPGPIVLRVLRELKIAHDAQPDEPLLVLTHAMGGQIVYDCLTWYMERLPEFRDIRIAVWCAAACQVGLFEEMKLFKASKPELAAPQRVPSICGPRLGAWFGYWDPSDVLSYATAPVFDGVQDRLFTSGTIPLQANGEYLLQPRFYRMLADDLAASLQSA
jgi:hypothetical protein